MVATSETSQLIAK